MAELERYAAFISYRHLPRDRNWARRLMARLETYQLPRDLQRRGFPKRLGKLFRDEDELPTSSDLNEQIRDALGRSDALIVICSPDTPKSKWVRREIEYFKAIGKSERIFVVLVDGEPSESFAPELLTREGDDGISIEVEPLGTDVRPSPNMSSRQLEDRAVLKLAAGILGVGYDELAQRELARRRRRLQTMAGGIAAALAVAAAGGWWFWDSRIAIKTEYCTAIAESWGLPNCVGSLDSKAVAARGESWRIQRQGGAALELALVNSHGRRLEGYMLDAPPLPEWRTDMAYQTYHGFDTDRGYVQQFDAAGNELRTLSYAFAPGQKQAVLTFSYGLSVGLRQESEGMDDSLPFNLSVKKISQIGQHRLSFDADGRVVRRDYQPLGSLIPARDEHGSTGKTYRYTADGLVASVTSIDAAGQPLNTRNGLAEVRYEFAPSHEVSRLGWYNAAGNPWPRGEDGFVSIDYHRDQAGNMLQVIAGNVQGETMVRAADSDWPGYLRQLNEHGDYLGADYVDATGKVIMPDWNGVVARYVDELDASFRMVKRIFRSTGGNAVMGPFGYAEWRRVLDAEGRVIEDAFFDQKGKPIAGASMSRYARDARGRIVEIRRFGPDGKPLPRSNWVTNLPGPLVRYAYDEAGNLVEEAYFDGDGAPAANGLAISRFVWTYDERGNPLSETHFNVLGVEAGSPQGNISRITARFDDRGNVVELRFMTPEGELLHTDWYGNPLRRMTYDERSMMLTYEQFAADNLYAEYNAVTRNTYDDVGHLLSEAYFDGSGKAIANDCYETIARIEYSYDADGNLASESFFGAEGEPVGGDDDVWRHTMVYDKRGTMISDEAYGIDGKVLTGASDMWDSFLPNYCDY